jgi:hypothetical protein
LLSAGPIQGRLQLSVGIEQTKKVAMLLAQFDKPVYAQRRYFVQEITGLDDVFDFLDEWPREKRNLAYETLVRYCREAANGHFDRRGPRELSNFSEAERQACRAGRRPASSTA